MTSKFSRFLHLERSREERPRTDEPSRLQNGNRFEAVKGPGARPQEAAVPEAHLERFKRQGEQPLALAEEQPLGAEHFPRCVRCQSENGRFLEKCLVCGADLNTPEQREYNERLRQSRQHEALQEREALEALARHRTEEHRRESEERYAVLLARLREQERMDDLWPTLRRHGFAGLELLKRLVRFLSTWLRGLKR